MGAARIETVDDGVGTYTYTYGDNGGLPTSIDVGLPSGPDVFTLAYDNQGNPVTVTYPNGTVATRTFDEQGIPQTRSYANAGTPILGFTQTTDVDGRVTAQTSTGSAQDFTYDALGRLIKVNDTRDGACTTRVYGFNATSERTSKTTYGPDTNNGCQTTTSAASWTGTYDTGNRVTNTGYTYDNLGRTRTTPLADVAAGGAMGALTTTYYPNDMVATLSQPVDNGTGTAVTKTNTYSLDPAGRIDQITTTQAGSETQRLKYRFAGTGDSPSSIATSTNAGANWTTTRYLQIPGIGMTGNTTNSTTEWALPNLHGDTVATQPNTTGATTLATYSETDEYGAPLTNTTTGRYGYLGTHQRSADTLGGLTLMGARLYNPGTGNFLSNDPIQGGGANRYSYPGDPVNESDMTGKSWDIDSRPLYDACRKYAGRVRCFVAMNALGHLLGGSFAATKFGVSRNEANAGRHFAMIVFLSLYISPSAAFAITLAHEGTSEKPEDSRRDMGNNVYAMGWFARHEAYARKNVGEFLDLRDLPWLFWHGVSLYRRGYMWSVCPISGGKKKAVNGLC